MRHERIYLQEGNENAYLDTYIADPTVHFTCKALLVIPGGGYHQICADREGEPIAHAFIPYGYNAFILHYTVGRKKPFPQPLIEATLAIKHIKDHAEEYGIDPEQLFVVGFSAGGHLAASTGVLWKNETVLATVPMPYGYNKPRGVMLIYPVIDDHMWSLCNLWCTDTPTEEQLDAVKISRHVDADSTTAFIMHTFNDQIVDVRNALALAASYTNANVPFEMHIYPDAPHGSALANAITAGKTAKFNNPSIAEWVRLAANWANTI